MNSLLTRTAAALVTVVAAATFIAGSSSTATATAASGLVPVGAAEVAALDADYGVPEVGYRLGRTPEQRAEWAALTATPESRKQLVGDLREAFAGIAQVHVQESPSFGRTGGVPDLAYGYNGHFWITLSYADAANGLISVGVWYCSTKLPGWLCNAIGNLLRSMVSGWGAANNHGVWGAAYWSGYVTGGRW